MTLPSNAATHDQNYSIACTDSCNANRQEPESVTGFFLLRALPSQSEEQRRKYSKERKETKQKATWKERPVDLCIAQPKKREKKERTSLKFDNIHDLCIDVKIGLQLTRSSDPVRTFGSRQWNRNRQWRLLVDHYANLNEGNVFGRLPESLSSKKRKILEVGG